MFPVSRQPSYLRSLEEFFDQQSKRVSINIKISGGFLRLDKQDITIRSKESVSKDEKETKFDHVQYGGDVKEIMKNIIFDPFPVSTKIIILKCVIAQSLTNSTYLIRIPELVAGGFNLPDDFWHCSIEWDSKQKVTKTKLLQQTHIQLVTTNMCLTNFHGFPT